MKIKNFSCLPLFCQAFVVVSFAVCPTDRSINLGTRAQTRNGVTWTSPGASQSLAPKKRIINGSDVQKQSFIVSFVMNLHKLLAHLCDFYIIPICLIKILERVRSQNSLVFPQEHILKILQYMSFRDS